VPDWIANHFVHPGYAWSWTAAALLAAPILIHLLNRLRYRRVRFAAMEFLLASEKRNKRRILIEQLLLLAARIAVILLAILLIGRFTAQAGLLNLFQEAQAHHVVLLDDSGSMLDRQGDKSAFDRAKEIVKRLASEGAAHTGVQKFTLVLLSRPDESVAGLSERTIDPVLLTDLSSFLEHLSCTYRRLSLAEGLAAAQARLLAEPTASRFLHVLSDFREVDWLDDKASLAVLRELDAAGVAVNLIRTVAETHDNLAATALTGDLQAAARGVPVAFQVEVTNAGPRTATDVRLTVSADETRLPLTLEFPEIPAGQKATQDFHVVFEQADRHTLSVALPPDSLEQDNTRFAALDVPNEIPVLVIDATPERVQGQYVVDAIGDIAGGQRVLTGVKAVLESPDYLYKYPLDQFQSIVLINVPQLPEVGVVALERYAAGGGGLAWFLGNLVQPRFYNERLYRDGEGIFPVRLAPTYALLPREAAGRRIPDLVPTDHPLLRVLTAAESVLLQYVTVNAWFPVDGEWWEGGTGRPASLTTVCALRNRAPLIFEHTWGPRQARIVTCLTAAGPLFLPPQPQQPDLMWNNWASDENAAISFLVLQLELQKFIGRKDRLPPHQLVGEPIVRTLNAAEYRSEVEIVTPDRRVTQLQATPLDSAGSLSASETRSDRPESPLRETVPPLQAVFRDTDAPGVYQVRLTRHDGPQEVGLIACNVPEEESRLSVASDEQLRRQLADLTHVELRALEAEAWLQPASPGNELRLPLLTALLVLLLLEQYLSYRFSYHPRWGAPTA
jgi:hypothetical protein